jgi:hypothetical protein
MISRGGDGFDRTTVDLRYAEVGSPWFMRCRVYCCRSREAMLPSDELV